MTCHITPFAHGPCKACHITKEEPLHIVTEVIAGSHEVSMFCADDCPYCKPKVGIDWPEPVKTISGETGDLFDHTRT